jgi:SagB-type dehydrogenase family enzyme
VGGILRRHRAFGHRDESESVSISELYHENSKLWPALVSPEAVQPEFTNAEVRAMARGYKRYRRHPHVPLPAIEQCPENPMSFDSVAAARRTMRDFADADLEASVLAKILHQTYGITGEIRLQSNVTLHCRAVPSAGALYPLEIYLGVQRVEGLAPGIYHYEVPDHSLALLTAGNPAARLYEICLRQEYARQAAVVFLITGVMERTRRKYGERGYRFVLLEAGHLAQNLHLASTAQELAFMTTGGYYDDQANELLHLHGVDEAVLYIGFLGRRAWPSAAETRSTTDETLASTDICSSVLGTT